MTASSQRGWARGAACAALACATALVHAGMDTASAAASGRLAVPSPARAKALALGFEPVIADWFWIQAVQVVGGSQGNVEDTEVLGRLIDVVTGLDPWVDHPYRFAALWLDEDEASLRHANRLLERGIAYHPLEWRNRFYLGYNLFFYLDEPLAAADVLEAALPLDHAPAYLGAMVARLRASGDDLDTAELFLAQLVADTEDPLLRADYASRLDEIQTERFARLLDDAHDEFRRRHGRDVREPAELWQGPLRVIARRPPAHPREPADWTYDSEAGEFVSSFYRKRYRLHVHEYDRERKKREESA